MSEFYHNSRERRRVNLPANLRESTRMIKMKGQKFYYFPAGRRRRRERVFYYVLCRCILVAEKLFHQPIEASSYVNSRTSVCCLACSMVMLEIKPLSSSSIRIFSFTSFVSTILLLLKLTSSVSVSGKYLIFMVLLQSIRFEYRNDLVVYVRSESIA